MKLHSTLLPGVVAVLTLAACGSSGTRTVVVTRVVATGTGTATTTVGGTATSPMSTTTTITSTSNSLVAAPKTTKTGTVTRVNSLGIVAIAGTGASTIVHLKNFRSPTGNIGCVMPDGFVRCDIAQRSWKPPPRPASCSHEVDFGQGLEVGSSGKGVFVCAGDPALNPDAKGLPYGTASVEGKLTCISAFTGMTCADLSTGHGFFISRQRYRVF